ncbi:type II toxin-antitoxin system TacA family antitoxin [Prosthecodimorpha staleyi]|uniref:DUF1778 domain-containing protein n=1 Tax=Prosthecodimorpha staleyi TaxID=2840188 RepID=A0A947GHX5_9HYPH|nr:DUF1778 domain-containing protein [Prosthecodimorpha staleyi]MBT9288259.1 DUF1778 domain-containing protein [Prosthecodimorpha staleyi]
MADLAPKRDVAVSMRFRDEDLDIIDRGAALSGLSRTEFMRRAALHEAQIAILNETAVRLSPEAYQQFVAAIDAPVTAVPAKMRERLSRKTPWTAAWDEASNG